MLSNPAAIRRVIGFYEKLYRSEVRSDDINESVFFFKDLPKVSDEANAGISGVLNLGELHKAVQSNHSLR